MNKHNQFDVGKMDLEWDSGAPDVTAEGHLVGSLYYPVDGDLKSAGKRYSSPSWLPSVAYAKGYAEFLFGNPRHWTNFYRRALTWIAANLVGRKSMQCLQDAPLAQCGSNPFPVILFSHGVGGNRFTYSVIAIRLAAAGFIVFCVEHADGSASTVRLAGQRQYMYYQTWTTKEERLRRTRYRVAEMKRAHEILQDLNRGAAVQGLHLSGGTESGAMWEGHMDLTSLAVCGHSFGGATVATLGASDTSVRCVLALDPWWPAVPEETEAAKGWSNPAPLLVLGSHDWNIPNEAGELKCGGGMQAAILRAASRPNLADQPGKAPAREEEEAGEAGVGGGAMLLVLEDSSHHTFSDLVALFGKRFGWIGTMLGFKSKLDPEEGTDLFMACIFAFFYLHLPLTGPQRSRFLDRAPATWQAACAAPFVTLLKDNGPACTTTEDRAAGGLDDHASANGTGSHDKSQRSAAAVTQGDIAGTPTGIIGGEDQAQVLVKEGGETAEAGMGDDALREREGKAGGPNQPVGAAWRVGETGVPEAVQLPLHTRHTAGGAVKDVANGNVDGLERALWLQRIVSGEDAAFRHIVGKRLYQLDVFL